MADPAARIAAAVAVPVALVAGALVYFGLKPSTAAPPKPASTAPVAMEAPALAERTATVCRALFARLPDRLGDLRRRPVTAGPEQNAAYGDPAVTLACGAGEVAPQGAQTLEIERVCWWAEEGPQAARWHLQGREVPVLVTVPKPYTGQNLVDLGGPVTASIAVVRAICV